MGLNHSENASCCIKTKTMFSVCSYSTIISFIKKNHVLHNLFTSSTVIIINEQFQNKTITFLRTLLMNAIHEIKISLMFYVE